MYGSKKMSNSVRPYLLTTSASNDSPGSCSRKSRSFAPVTISLIGIAARMLGRSGHSWYLPNMRAPLLRGISIASSQQDLANERGDTRVLGVEPVRADVEMEIAVVERPAEAADDVVALDDGDLVAAARELISDGEPGDAGADDGD